jgi:4-amino-4-deoxy-L-arabinose transferase-like glycosyltransferase
MSRRAATAALGGLFLVTLLTSAVYFSRDTVPPRWDAALHLLNALEYRDLLRAGRLQPFLWGHYAYYPPLVYQLTGGLHALLGPAPAVGAAVLDAFALLLMAATYRLGRTVGGRPAALLGAAVTLLLPIVTVFRREFALDVPLTALATVCVLLALKQPFAARRRAAALGAVIGLGLLTKWAFALVAAGPIVYAVVAALREAPARTAALRRMGLALAVAVVLAGPWYGAHFRRLGQDARLNAVDVARLEGDPAPASLASLSFYPRMAADEWFYVPLTLVLLAGVAAAVRRRGRALLLLGVVAGPGWLLLALVPNKDPRYGLPLVPVLAVVLADGLLGGGGGRWRRALAAAAVGLLAVQHLGAVAALGPASLRLNVCWPQLRARVYEPADPHVYFRLRGGWRGACGPEWTLYNPYSYFGRRPRREDWRVEEIAAAAAAAGRVAPPPAGDVHLNPVLLAYAARRAGHTLVWAPPAEATAWIWKGASVPPALAAADLGRCPRFSQPDGGVVTVCGR